MRPLLRQVIDDDDACRRLQVFREALDVGRRVLDVVQNIVKQRDVDGLRQLRVRRLTGNRLDVRDARRFCLPLDMREEVSIDLDRQHLTLAPAAFDNGTTNSPDPAPRSTTTSPGRSFIAATTSGILSAAIRSGASSVAIQSSAGRDARCAPAAGASTTAKTKTIAARFMHDYLPCLSRFVNERRPQPPESGKPSSGNRTTMSERLRVRSERDQCARSPEETLRGRPHLRRTPCGRGISSALLVEIRRADVPRGVRQPAGS